MKTTKRRKSSKDKGELPLQGPPIRAEDEIRRRAHQLFLERGGVPGHELDDWLQAEREIAARQRAKD